MKSKQVAGDAKRGMNGSSVSPTAEAVGERGTLNVILHGTFAFKVNTHRIEALMPRNEQHVYRAGNWLGETDLRPGVYELQGVEVSPPNRANSFSREHNLVLTCPKKEPQVKPYARLVFPRPATISSLRRVKVPAQTIQPEPKNYRGQLTTLQVFTYKFKSDTNLRLVQVKSDGKKTQRVAGAQAVHRESKRGHFWEPSFASDNTINLHIFSAHDHEHSAGHPETAFQQVAALLGHELRLTSPPPASELEIKELPEGVMPEETEDLADRVKRMTRLGRMRRQGRDLNQLWLDTEPLDGDPGPCTCLAC